MKYNDYKYLGICISIIIFVVMVLFFLTKMIDASNKDLNEKIIQEENCLKEYNDCIAKYQDINTYQQSIDVKTELVEAKIPKEMQEAKILAMFNQIANKANVEIIEMTPQNLEKVNVDNIGAINKYEQQNFSVSVQGDYFAIVDFFRQINLADRLINVVEEKVFVQNDTIIAKLTLQIYANN